MNASALEHALTNARHVLARTTDDAPREVTGDDRVLKLAYRIGELENALRRLVEALPE